MVKVYVLDTSAFLNLNLALEGEVPLYTTNLVINELRNHLKKLSISIGIKRGILKVRDPPAKAISKVRNLAEDKGELKLSATDISVLALALHLREEELEPIILTDDYSVMNVASHLGVKFKAISKRGIRVAVDWLIYCPSCGRTFKTWIEKCPYCGSKVKRKPKKSKRIGT
ncbi:MAG: hypothetical protein B6U69_00660 [Thermofilum sp. ex4484_15]|nr:MAG: hypothetical protein B6U69_00660 [Thermofilum sp. ex4484_15]